YNNRGVSQIALGYIHAAIEDFTSAIHIDPDLADAYDSRGAAYDTLQFYDEAIADYDKSIAIHPENPITYNNRGNTKLQRGDQTGA
ncbi:MAG: tetratricopeptide repeat protein, partial [Chloroflexota bacterium]